MVALNFAPRNAHTEVASGPSINFTGPTMCAFAGILIFRETHRRQFHM